MRTLNIGKDFHEDPSGRFFTDGPGSGEEFREKFLMAEIRQLKEGEKLEVILDDHVEGYGSSFLSEGFAGCVKYGYITNQELLSKLTFKYTDSDFEFYKNRIIQYIQDSEFQSREYKKNKK